MTKEEKIAELINIRDNFNYTLTPREVFDDAIKALEQEPCEDCISRQAVLDLCDMSTKYKIPYEYYEDKKNWVRGWDDGRIINMTKLKRLPSVTPQPKTGHWEWVQYDSNPNIGNWHCSECKTIIPHILEETDNRPIYKWCPMCGTKMVEPQESEE